LGDLILKDKERKQPKAGRLDLLLQDPETDRRYEVEIQLGRTNETHIIRTVEYWDIERRRYPQYDHCAVIVAEEITSRFFNVIGLFNRAIPLIAIQMNAFKVGEQIGLAFTTILDELTLALEEEDEETEPADRSFWETIGSKESMAMADVMLSMIQGFAPGFALKYNKSYIGLAKDGQANNFVAFIPTKKHLRVVLRLLQSDDIQNTLKEAGLDLMGYDKKWRQYRLRLTKKDIEDNRDSLTTLMKTAYEE
jgi:hypothetical protein